MTSQPVLLPEQERTALFETLLLDPGTSVGISLERSGQAALALALAHGIKDPNGTLAFGANPAIPLLLATLRSLFVQRQSEFDRGLDVDLVRVAHDDPESWPQDVVTLPARERLALWLLSQGADPWTQDADGKDGLDWAVQAHSRTLVHALLRHPGCPSKEVLRARTSGQVGREVPWLHTLAYFNGVGLFGDLVSEGWDPVHLDKNGWPPAAWVNKQSTLVKILSHATRDQSAPLLLEIGKAWSRRVAQKQTTHYFQIKDLEESLANLFTVTPEDQERVKLHRIMDLCLAANPAKQSYHYAGRKFRYNPNASSEAEKIIEHFSWRKQEKAGAAKGTWSLLAAYAWGCARGERDKNADQIFSQIAIEVLSGQPPEVRRSWLDEEIRPGLSNRGLLCWSMGQAMDAAQRSQLTPGLQGSAAVRARVEEATFAVITMHTKNASSQWMDELSKRWHGLCEKENVFSGSRVEPWMWDCIVSMTNVNLIKPTRQTYAQLSRLLVSDLEQSEPDRAAQALAPALAWLSIGVGSVSGISQYNSSDAASRNEFYKQRQDLTESVQRALVGNPGLAEHISLNSYPFANKAKEESSLPEKDAWQALIRKCKLSTQIAPPPRASSSKMRM